MSDFEDDMDELFKNSDGGSYSGDCASDWQLFGVDDPELWKEPWEE